MTTQDSQVVIAGVAEQVMGRGNPAPPYRRLVVDTALATLQDAKMEIGDIDGVVLCTSIPQPFEWSAAEVAEHLGIGPAWVATLPYGGKPATAVVEMARGAIKAGLATNVLVIGADNYATTLGLEGAIELLADGLDAQYEQPFGPLIPTAFAMMAMRHMKDYGTTLEQLAAIPVAARRHAALNPQAEIRDPLTVEDVVADRVITSPFTRSMVALVSTGGSQGFVVSAASSVNDADRSVEILGYGECGGFMNITQAKSLTEFEHTKRAGENAFRQAGIDRSDLDFAELYDPVAIVPIILLEDLGFCAKGEGGAFVEDGAVELGGRLPIITHGGVSAYRHPGMGGPLDCVVEAVVQLRGEAGDRQVRNAETGLVHGEGSWLANNAIVILGKPQ